MQRPRHLQRSSRMGRGLVGFTWDRRSVSASGKSVGAHRYWDSVEVSVSSGFVPAIQVVDDVS
jgi:hypothetical protein